MKEKRREEKRGEGKKKDGKGGEGRGGKGRDQTKLAHFTACLVANHQRPLAD